MKRVTDLEKQKVNEVLDRYPTLLSGFYKNPLGGPSNLEFERTLAQLLYVDPLHAIAVSNGTTALHLALLACDVGPGDEVITTPLTFSATATAILMCGAKPVFIDVDYDTYNLDPSYIHHAITDRTKAIIPVHLLGTPCDMKGILEETKGDIFIIEDNAQAFGATYMGNPTGTSIGDISTISFQETKTITTGGEGGAIITLNPRLAKKCRYLRNHGSQYGKTQFLTYNYRMTELQAAFGTAQLMRFNEILDNQIKNAEKLIKSLPKEFKVQKVLENTTATRYIIGCTVPTEFKREEFIEKLTKFGINKNLPGETVGLGYQNTIMDLPLLRQYHRDCVNAEILCNEFIWFDITRWKSPEQIDLLSGIVEKCLPQ